MTPHLRNLQSLMLATLLVLFFSPFASAMALEKESRDYLANLAAMLGVPDPTLSTQRLWYPFFAPKVSREELLRQLAAKPGNNARVALDLGKGGEGRVEAVGRRRKGQTEVLTLKSYYESSVAKFAVRSLKEVRGLADAGDLGELKVIGFRSEAWGQVSLDLIEGQSLKTLIERNYDNPNGARLYERYQQILATAVKRLPLRGYEIETYAATPLERCGDLLRARRSIFDEVFSHGSLIVDKNNKQRFGLAADNIVVEWNTGDMYLIDTN